MLIDIECQNGVPGYEVKGYYNEPKIEIVLAGKKLFIFPKMNKI